MDDKARQLQQALADQLKAGGLLNDFRLEAAFRAVPRHLFLPEFELGRAYTDDAIGTKFLEDGRPISSSSQPAIMAIMLDQLGLERGQRALEIGAGTGYNAALLSHIVGEEGSVVSVDLDEDIVIAARQHLSIAGYERVRVVQADGLHGFADQAPYDRVVLTVGASDISPAWWQQLAPGGRLVAPLELAGPSAMVSAAFVWRNDHLESLSLKACGFMMLRGEGAREEYSSPIEGYPDLCLGPNDHEGVDPKIVASELRNPVRDLASEVRATPWQLERDIRFWLARFGLQCFALNRRRPALPGRAPAMEISLGVLQDGALCLLKLDRPRSDPNIPGHIWMYRYGEAQGLAKEIVQRLRDWEAAGRPSTESLSIRAYPKDTPNLPNDSDVVIEKRSVRLLLNWPEKL